MVDTQQDYVAWLGQQQTFAQLSVPQQTGAADQVPGKTMASGLKIAAKLETVGSR
jgi:cytochrome c oxidase subunit 2